MSKSERLKIYQGYADIGRKWSQVMDAKAGFLSALNAALIGFIWTGASTSNACEHAHNLAMISTVIAFISLFMCLLVVFPRTSLKQAFGVPLKYSGNHHAISYYNYVANNFPHGKFETFMEVVNDMDEDMLSREALEQHYTISHIVNTKSNVVAQASILWLVAMILSIIYLFLPWLK